MANFKWSVKGILLEAMKVAHAKQRFQSPEFPILQSTGYLDMYPNGQVESQQGMFTIHYRYKKYDGETVVAAYSFFIAETNTKVMGTMRLGGPTGGDGLSIDHGQIPLSNIQNLESLTIALNMEIMQVLDKNKVDITHKHAESVHYECKQPDETVTEDWNSNVNDSMLESIMSKLNVLSNKVESLQKQMNEMKMKKHAPQNHASVNKIALNPQQKQLQQWLTDTVGLAQYFEVFVENGIEDLSTAALLTTDTLKAIGIDKIGHQMKIYNHVRRLKQGGNNEGNTAYV